ncbi:MAG: hypothetical protein Q8880_12090 [Bacteroidota bacterium]|nr:hypothetical protein [Bacteroidota bacterium]
MKTQRGQSIMSNKDFEEYLDKINKYTEKVANEKVSPKESLESLVKAGICNKEKKLNSMYRLA